MTSPLELNIKALLGDIPKSQFVEEYYHKLPFSPNGAAQPVCKLGTWGLLGDILGQDDVDVMVVREGQQYAGPDPATSEAAKALSAERYTILVRYSRSKTHSPCQRSTPWTGIWCSPN